LIDWLDPATASAYQVLAEERWDEFRDTVRRDLGDGFETFAEESRARVREDFGAEVMEALETGGKKLVTVSEGTLKAIDPELVKRLRDFLTGSDWNNRRFAVAALAGLARNGESEDGPLARPWLDSEYREVREAAAHALARAGGEGDVGKLLELSQLQGGDVIERAALSLSPGPAGAALALLDVPRGRAALLGARHLYSHVSELSNETLEMVLHHTSEEVRRVGVACALTRYEHGDLEDLLDRYTSAGSYYYNVVFWLDRALFAPAYLRDLTRAELVAFAAEERPTELPSALSRALRPLTDEFVRSRSSA
jgi:hypothetical protein